LPFTSSCSVCFEKKSYARRVKKRRKSPCEDHEHRKEFMKEAGDSIKDGAEVRVEVVKVR
jgi:hypothetical protein